MIFIEFFPFPFLVCLAALGTLVVNARKRGWKYLLGLVSFGAYLMALLFVLFFPIAIPPEWPANLNMRHTMQALSEVNLVPFRNAAYLIEVSAARALIRDATVNIIMTVPFGFGIAYLKRLKFTQILFFALIVGVSLEGLQLLIKLATGVFYHAVDINDVLMNGLGFLVGAILYLLANKIFRFEHDSQLMAVERDKADDRE